MGLAGGEQGLQGMGEIREGYMFGNMKGKGHATAQADSHWFVTAGAWVESQASLWDLWWTKGHWDRFFSEDSTLISPFRYYSINSPYSFIHLSLMLCNLSD